MALSIDTIGGAALDPTFFSRCKGAMYLTAGTVFGEAAGTANHANRLLWVKAVASEPNLWVNRMATSVASLNVAIVGTTLAQITDAQIQTSMDNLVNFYSTLVV